MNIEVSIGEVIDKYSILELKQKKIKDPVKLIEINKELDALQKCKTIINNNKYYYKLLLYVNEKIWDMTDQIKIMDSSWTYEYATISKYIFDYNQKRFRIKRIFNITSNLKEQKSYAETCCNIIIKDYQTALNKIPEINYLSIEYDLIIIDDSYKYIFPHITNFTQLNKSIISHVIDINDLCLDDKEIVIFNF